VSQRRACKVLGQGRSSQRYQGRRQEKDKALVKRLHELSAKHPRDGYRRMTARLKAEGFAVNKKRVQRLWRQEGLKVPRQAKKKRRLGREQLQQAKRLSTS
jgi:putative transposase